MKRLCLCLALASLLGLGGQAFALIGTADVVPAATLLLPYFEVDLDTCDTAGSTANTLFAINNASDAAVLTHVTVWSDQSIPVLDFDIYLTGYDVQTVNLCDILKNGNLPRTAPSNTDPSGAAIGVGISPRGPLSTDIAYPGCVGTLPYTNPALNAGFRAHLQAALRGLPSPAPPPLGGLCYGSKHGDSIMRGYVTIDTVSTCNIFFPSQLASGYAAVLTNENTLWGDFFMINSAQNFAQGETLVHIESCGGPEGTPTPRPGSQYVSCASQGIVAGTATDHTFYGRYDSASTVDDREPLPTTMGARYLNGGGFTGGTDFLVWREGGNQVSAVGYNCALSGPSQWFPLTSTQIVVFDETEQILTAETCPSGFDCDIDIAIPNEAQRVDIGLDIPSPFNFGWIYLNLQVSGAPMPVLPAYQDPFAQMWLITVMDASGRFSVGFDGVAFDNANRPAGIIP